MKAKLEVIRGATAKTINLRLPTIIGRGREAAIKLPASIVSRHHCEIYDYDGQLAVRDLGSSNGTIVNGHKIDAPTFLTSDDDLTIGPVTFRITLVTSEQPMLIPLEQSDKIVAPTEESTTEQREDSSLDAGTESGGQIPVSPTSRAELAESLEASDDCNTNNVNDDGDSVLKYAESENGGSFVGISPADMEEIAESPVFDSDSKTEDEVDGDDSSLNRFFRKLDP